MSAITLIALFCGQAVSSGWSQTDISESLIHMLTTCCVDCPLNCVFPHSFDVGYLRQHWTYTAKANAILALGDQAGVAWLARTYATAAVYHVRGSLNSPCHGEWWMRLVCVACVSVPE